MSQQKCLMTKVIMNVFKDTTSYMCQFRRENEEINERTKNKQRNEARRNGRKPSQLGQAELQLGHRALMLGNFFLWFLCLEAFSSILSPFQAQLGLKLTKCQ